MNLKIKKNINTAKDLRDAFLSTLNFKTSVSEIFNSLNGLLQTASKELVDDLELLKVLVKNLKNINLNNRAFLDAASLKLEDGSTFLDFSLQESLTLDKYDYLVGAKSTALNFISTAINIESFTSFVDTPNNYTGAYGYFLKADSTSLFFEFQSYATSLLDLTESTSAWPSSTGQLFAVSTDTQAYFKEPIVPSWTIIEHTAGTATDLTIVNERPRTLYLLDIGTDTSAVFNVKLSSSLENGYRVAFKVKAGTASLEKVITPVDGVTINREQINSLDLDYLYGYSFVYNKDSNGYYLRNKYLNE